MDTDCTSNKINGKIENPRRFRLRTPISNIRVHPKDQNSIGMRDSINFTSEKKKLEIRMRRLKQYTHKLSNLNKEVYNKRVRVREGVSDPTIVGMKEKVHHLTNFQEKISQRKENSFIRANI